MIGEKLGDYLVLARIGQGGMGTVWLAEDRSDAARRRVAVKVLDARPEQALSGLPRFAQELDVLRRLAHPRIVQALGPLRSEGDRHFFAMEWVRGRNLAQVLLEAGRLDVRSALSVAADVLEGLAAAHERGVLHRDLKSANVLVEASGRAKVCDFGLARALDQTRLTLSGQVLGTPAYASPEQARGQDSRRESDVYAAGVVLYEALTGTLPFRAETPLAVLRMHLDEAPDPPSTRRPDLPPALDALLLRALAKRPEDRFPGAAAMLEAVRSALAALGAGDAGGPAGARPRPPSGEPWCPPPGGGPWSGPAGDGRAAQASGTDAFGDSVRRMVEAQERTLEQAIALPAARLARRRLVAMSLGLVAGVVLLAGGPGGRGSPASGPGALPAAVDGRPASGGPAGIGTREAPWPAPPAADAGAAPAAILVLRDGRRVEGQLISIAGGEVRLLRPGGQEETYPRAEVHEVSFAGR